MLAKTHPLAAGTGRFAISEKLRGLCCLVGQEVVYEKASDLLAHIGGVDISGMQIQRLCLHYGGLLDELVQANCQAVIPTLEVQDKAGPVYVMVDGAMLFTRPKEWREIKLGRIFSADTLLQLSPQRKEARRSIYVSHLGSVNDFFPKLERHLVAYKHKIIVGDGAKWIWNWADDNYPGAVQILDFFHAKEKLVLFARAQWPNELQAKQWVDTQLERLREDGVEVVIMAVRGVRAANSEAKDRKAKLIDYYVEHAERMQYKTYREQGLLIGSGPIEAAHRSVIQQRLKLSGQKWTVAGANAMANLRCYRNSEAWDQVLKVVKAA